MRRKSNCPKKCCKYGPHSPNMGKFNCKTLLTSSSSVSRYALFFARNPTPPGVTMREGIPHWPAYTEEKKEFMSINKYWNVRNDYTLVCMRYSREKTDFKQYFVLSITQWRWTRRRQGSSVQIPLKIAPRLIGNRWKKDVVKMFELDRPLKNMYENQNDWV